MSSQFTTEMLDRLAEGAEEFGKARRERAIADGLCGAVNSGCVCELPSGHWGQHAMRAPGSSSAYLLWPNKERP